MNKAQMVEFMEKELKKDLYIISNVKLDYSKKDLRNEISTLKNEMKRLEKKGSLNESNKIGLTRKIERLENQLTNYSNSLKWLKSDRKERNKEIKSSALYKDRAKMVKLVKATEEINGFVWSKSPSGWSFYYHIESEKITWGHKPENSLRISDHWNWDGGVHCPVLGAKENTILKTKVAKYNNGYYKFM